MKLRIRELRGERGLTLQELADKSGVSRSYLNEMELGAKTINAVRMQQIARALGTTVRNLIEVDPGDSPVSDLPAPLVAPEGVMVPIYDVQASAGPGTYVDHEVVADQLSFPPDYLRTITSSNPRNLAIIGVRGRSMLPALNDGDVVMLDMSKRHLGFDGMFVLNIEGVLQVKRIGRTGRAGHVTIVSDNEAENPPYEVAIDDVTVVGRVLWSGRRE